MNKKMTYQDRYEEALRLIIGRRPPSEMVADWIAGRNGALQDWVREHYKVWWSQSTACLRAAHELAVRPVLGDESIDYGED